MNKKRICLVLFILVIILFKYGIATALAEACNDDKISIKIWDFPRWLEDEKSLDRFSWITRKIKEFENLHPK